MRASSAGSVSIVSVFLFVAVFSTIENGYPGFTRVILKNVEPKSNPITIPCTIDAVHMSESASKHTRVWWLL